MSTTIVDSGNYITITKDNVVNYIHKPYDAVIVGTNAIEVNNKLEFIDINYDDVDSPSSSNISELLSIIIGYLSSDIVTIDTVHDKLHKGLFYSGGHYSSSVADAATLDVLIQNLTLNTHVVFNVALAGDFTFTIYETPTFSNVGNAITMSNHNRKSENTFSGTVTHTPTITGTGTQINGTIFVPGGEGGKAMGSLTHPFSNEFVLKSNTSYLARITNVSGQTHKGSLTLSSYQTI